MAFALLHAHECTGMENKMPRLPREESTSPKQIFYWSDIASINVDVGWADTRKSSSDNTPHCHTCADATAAGFRTDADYSKEIEAMNGRREFVQWLPDEDTDQHDLEGVGIVCEEAINCCK